MFWVGLIVGVVIGVCGVIGWSLLAAASIADEEAAEEYEQTREFKDRDDWG